jgi:hypothetical protein
MSNADDAQGGLPDVLRNAGRPIVIYQGAPPPNEFAQVSSALGVLVWLALVTLCLGVAGFYAWMVWGGGFDRTQFSPIYAQGRPIGLMKQLEERREISALAEGLIEFRDAVQSDNFTGRISTESHALLTDAQGIDALRRRWDAMCAAVSTRIFERRIGLIDVRAAELRQARSISRDPDERQRIDSELSSLRQERADQFERRRTGSDPALRCTPAAEAPVCNGAHDDVWCNPTRARPDEFNGEGR